MSDGSIRRHYDGPAFPGLTVEWAPMGEHTPYVENAVAARYREMPGFLDALRASQSDEREGRTVSHDDVVAEHDSRA